MTQTPLEKAARAAAFYRGGEDRDIELAWLSLDEVAREKYRKQVRAVLMAVREPDDSVAEAGNDADYIAQEGCSINRLNDTQDGRPATAIVFTAMIDHILRGGE